MQENQLKMIEDMSFNFLTNLRVALFSDNQLSFNTSLSVYQDEYGKKSPFHGCSSLEELYLVRNNISEIFGDWIISNLKLRILDLQYNQIPYISVSRSRNTILQQLSMLANKSLLLKIIFQTVPTWRSLFQTEDLQFLSNNIKVDLRHNQIEHIYLSTAEEVAKYQEVARDVIILVEDNPIACDCDMYDFLRYLEGRMHPYVQNYFHIIPGGLTCKSPEWLSDIAVAGLKSKTLKCQVLDPCPDECACWVKRNDRAFLVDCSNRKLTSVPRNIKTIPHHRLELNFTGNKLTGMPPMADIGLNNVHISQLLLSNNNIHDVSANELPLSIDVCIIDPLCFWRYLKIFLYHFIDINRYLYLIYYPDAGPYD